MSRYVRARQAGGIWFFTLVTAERRRWLGTEVGLEAFRSSYRAVVADQPFETPAMVVLPDHLHCIWRLPADDGDFSGRWQRIKRRTTEAMRRQGIEGSLWQPRFWEHLIRDERDLRAHLDYVHYNPVRHGLVRLAAEWSASSIHRYIRAGWYPADWGVADPDGLEAAVLANGGDP